MILAALIFTGASVGMLWVWTAEPSNIGALILGGICAVVAFDLARG